MKHLSLCLVLAATSSALLAVSPVSAQVVAANCTSPACIEVVGQSGGVPAVDFGRFTIIARDAANQPVPGAIIRISFMDCHDIGFSLLQHQPEGEVRAIFKSYR